MYKTSDMDVNAQIIINANKDIKKNRIIINKFINGIIFYYIMSCFQGFYPSNLKKKKKLKIGCIFLTSSSFTLTNYVFFLDFIEMSSLAFRYFTSIVPFLTKKNTSSLIMLQLI